MGNNSDQWRVQGHMGRVGEERCAHIRALVVVNQALMSRQHLEEQADNWLREAGTTPPGNGIDRSEWEVRGWCSLVLAWPMLTAPYACRSAIVHTRRQGSRISHQRLVGPWT